MSRRSEISNIFIGIALLVVCHLAYLMLVGLLLWLFPVDFFSSSSQSQSWSDPLIALMTYSTFVIGLVQILYVLPLCLWLSRRRRFNTVKGVIIGAVITLLLNGSCFLFLDVVLKVLGTLS
jgi:hypothetical protein